MVSFPILDRRMSRDLRQLHDFLWSPAWKGDEDALRENLLRDARELDAFLRAGGRLRRNAEALARAWGRGPEGASLFELLDHTHHLTAATERVRKSDYKGAGEHVAQTVGSVSIGVAAAAGHFEFVDDWKSDRTDFQTYTGRLADALEAKGIERAGRFKRVLNAARDFGTSWDEGATKAEQALAAGAAVANGAWCVLTGASIRRAIGSPPKFAYEDFARVVARIASRL